ncbi:MAG: hypothetical protein IJQ67_04795 [Bacilli bacterium]|nr:hypothetical protein [Bacilli bacterium]
MAAPLSSNTYLSKNKLTNQIAQYDIAVCQKYNNQELKLYDIILFKKDNKRIIHRIVEVVDDNTFITQGDNNPKRDDFTVQKDEIMGIYINSLVFMSFVNNLGYTPGFYVLFVGVTYDIGVILYFELKREKLKKNNTKEIEE